MDNTITADKSEAIKRYRAANAETKATLEQIFGKEIFQSKDITDRIQSWFDIIELTKPSEEVITFLEYRGSDPIFWGAVNHARAELIAEAYNEGEILDATKQGVEIWIPVFERPSLGFSHSDCGGWSSTSTAGARLGFKNKKLSDDAGSKFQDVYKNLILKIRKP